jgi:CheY-like chemotaxis protein
MPVADGIALIRGVRSSNAATVPALAVTAYAREEERTQALSAGFDAHLVKPLEPADLIRTAAELTRATRFRRRPRPRRESPLRRRLRQSRSRPNRSRPIRRFPAVGGSLVEDSADTRTRSRSCWSSTDVVAMAGCGAEGIEIALGSVPTWHWSTSDSRTWTATRWRAGCERSWVRASRWWRSRTRGAEARARALEAGFDSHVAKPVDFDRLHALIRKTD